MTDAVQKRMRTATKKDWNGVEVYLRKLGANRTLKYLTEVTELKEKKLSPAEDRAAILNLHSTNISQSYCNENGDLIYGTPEGLADLLNLPFDDLVSLGDLVLDHSGFGVDEKKSTQPENSSHSNSAETSETSTVPIPTTCLAG